MSKKAAQKTPKSKHEKSKNKKISPQGKSQKEKQKRENNKSKIPRKKAEAPDRKFLVKSSCLYYFACLTFLVFLL